jgi:S1-C subfamily serine protease
MIKIIAKIISSTIKGLYVGVIFLLKMTALSIAVAGIIHITPQIHHKALRQYVRQYTDRVETQEGRGTGFLLEVKKDGKKEVIVVTNRHVCLKDSGTNVLFRGQAYTAIPSQREDLCIIKQSRFSKGLTLANNWNSGQTACNFGHTFGGVGRLTCGELISTETVTGLSFEIKNEKDEKKCAFENGKIVNESPLSKRRGCLESFDNVETTILVNYGNSGSAAFNSLGQVVGVVQIKNESNWAGLVPLNNLKHFLKQQGYEP